MSRVDADELLRRLILRRFNDRFSQFPHSLQRHILTCPTGIRVREVTNADGMGLCGTCELTHFAALISCDCGEVEFRYAEDGRLDSIIADLSEEAERDPS